MYRDHRQGPAKLGRPAAGQEATTLAIISHTLGNFCRPATAVSSLGSSPQPYENLGLFFLKLLQTITYTALSSFFVSRKKWQIYTGKSFSEAFILESVNP